MDKKYIFQAFNFSWNNTDIIFNIVNKHKTTQDGRAVYRDSISYFVGGSFAQIVVQNAITNLVNNKLTNNSSNGAEGYNSKFNDYITTIEQSGGNLDTNIIKCLYLANIQNDLYTTIKDQTGIDKLSINDIQSLMLKKYNSTFLLGREDVSRSNRQYLLSSDIELDSIDSPTASILKTTTHRPSSPPILTKPSTGRSSSVPSTSPDVDPYHIDKAEWLSLSTTTKEKINAMRKSLRENRSISSNIKLLRSSDDQESVITQSPLESSPVLDDTAQDPFNDTMKQFLVRAYRQFIISTSPVRQQLKITVPFNILRQVVAPTYGRLVSDSGADTGAISDS